MTSIVLLTLFGSAFLSATILPGASELLLIAVIAEAQADPVAAVIVAGIGNTLGSATNWALGRWFVHYADRPWFPVRRTALEKAESVFKRYGVWTLLFSWLPIGGDALTLAAGCLRVRLTTFILLVATGKFARYALLAAGTLGILR